jgi:DNA-binding NarL/FixJ family response regulator
MPDGSVDAWIAQHIELETSAPVAMVSTADTSRQPVASLSAREREVLAALADGLTNQELAERLFISERTANRHLSNIFTKLGVRNRTAAARVAIEAGLAG